MDAITVSIEKIEDEVLTLKRNIASWVTFSAEGRALPIVSYSSSYNGKDEVKSFSDLSKLEEDAQEVISNALEDWHGAAVIQALVELGRTVDSLKAELMVGASEPVSAEAVGEPSNEFSS